MRFKRAFVYSASGLFCLVSAFSAFSAQAIHPFPGALLLSIGMALSLVGLHQLKTGRSYDFKNAFDASFKTARLFWFNINRPKRLNLRALQIAGEVIIMLLTLAAVTVTPLAIVHWIETTFP